MLIITVGGVIGYTNALISTLPQITCSVGYSSEFTGICVTLLLFCGVIGGTASSFLYRHTGKVEEQAKVSYAMMALLTIPLLYMLVTPDEDVILAFFFAM